MKRLSALALMTLCAAPLGAHPHIFVDTGLDLRFDEDGRLKAVKVTWAYDEFYSLLITEDRALDADFDGEMTADEIESLQGFDMNWSEGFNGDLVIMQNGEVLPLSGPMEATATYTGGRITTTHVRQVMQAQADAPLEVKPYDKTYYTAYDITLPVQIEGADNCRDRLEVPDLEAGLLLVGDLLSGIDDMTVAEEEDMPDIGIVLATTVHVTCDVS